MNAFLLLSTGALIGVTVGVWRRTRPKPEGLLVRQLDALSGELRCPSCGRRMVPSGPDAEPFCWPCYSQEAKRG